MALDQELEEISELESKKEMSFFDHIDELRKHLLRSSYILIANTVVAFIFIEEIFHKVIIGPLRKDFFVYEWLCQFSHFLYNNDQLCVDDFNIVLQNTEMAGQFMMSFKLSFLIGLIVSMPFILWQIWLFVRPALNKKEISSTRGFVFYTTGLFLVGVSFGYFVLCPISVNFLSKYTISSLIKNEINMQSVISFMSLLTFGTGLIFELPILMYFLAKIGILSSSFLKKYRKYAFVVILIVAAIATPPDVVSQIVLTIPLYMLYEIGILITVKVEKNKLKEA